MMMSSDHDELEGVVVACCVGIGQHKEAVEAFHGLVGPVEDTMSHKQHMVVAGEEAASWLVVHIWANHSHKGCTGVDSMAVGSDIHKEADDSSGHACIQGWHCCCRLTLTYYIPTPIVSNHNMVNDLMGGGNSHPLVQQQQPLAWTVASSNAQDA
jgi:hypothetical protein